MTDKRIAKLLNKAIKRDDLEALLSALGFECKMGKGSHKKWIKHGCEPIIIATHNKEIKSYQIRQVIQVLKSSGLL